MTSSENQPPQQSQRAGGGCLGGLVNLLTAFILLAALLFLAAILAFFFVPDRVQAFLADTSWARLVAGSETVGVAPPTAVAAAAVPTLTHTPQSDNTAVLLPTWTPIATQIRATGQQDLYTPASTEEPTATATFPTFTPTPTDTPTPTLTPTPSNTPTATPVGPTATATVTRSPFPFTKSDNSPFYHRNFANNAGCGWLGIAGEVLDLNRNPVPRDSYVVHVWDSGINERVSVGSAPAYGPSGWEQFVFNSIVIRTYKVQLETPQGTPVSQVYTVQTRASCNENLLQINFVQNH